MTVRTVIILVLIASPTFLRAATTSTIAAHSHTAASSETFVLCGQFYSTDAVKVWDGTTLADAEILLQDAEKIMAAVPNGISTGTLWVWIADGANSVTLNNPEPWWIQPGRCEIGDTTRIFGRNLARGSSPTLTVVLKSATAGTTFTYSATVTEPCVAQLTIAPTDDNGAAIFQDNFNWYLDEPKIAGVGMDYAYTYGVESYLTLTAIDTIPTTSVNVDDYGAIPNDDDLDSTAIRQAIVAASSAGGGTVLFSAGRYLFDEQTASAGLMKGMAVAPKVGLQGQGIDATTITYRGSGIATPGAAINIETFGAITSMTLSFEGNLSVPITGILGGRCYLENLKITSDGTSITNFIFMAPGAYSVIRNVTAYCPDKCLTLRNHSHVDGLHIYGPKAMGEYSDHDGWQFGSPMIMTGGVRNVIVENCTATYRGGPLRRWYVGQAPGGGAHFMYFARNTLMMKTSPYANAGETILFETGGLDKFGKEGDWENRLGGQVTVDPTTPTILHLSSKMTSATYATPHCIAVTTGTGFGQIRTGMVRNDGLTVDIDRPFTLEPDAGSTVMIGHGAYRTIFYDNDLASTVGLGSTGIAYCGSSQDGIVSSNSFTGFGAPYLSVHNKLSSVLYWHEVENNIFSDSFYGPLYMVDRNGVTPVRQLGQAYRNNMVRSQKDLPPVKFFPKYTGMGTLVTYSGGYDPSMGVYCDVYEDNVVDGGVRGFHMPIQYGDWVVLRRNQFSNVTSSSLLITPAIRTVQQYNTTNVLPLVDISATTTIPYRTSFKPVGYTWPFEGYVRDYFAWGDKSGSMTLTISDPEGDPGTTVTTITGASAMAGATLNNYPIEWSGLDDGLHEITVSVTDGNGTGTKRIYLFVGGHHDDFSGITEIKENPTSDVGWLITTTDGIYVTSRTAIYYEPLHYHKPYKHGELLEICPRNQEVSLRSVSTSDTLWSKAVIAFIQCHYGDAIEHVRLRLLYDENSYYEFYDHNGIYDNDTNYQHDRKLIKVVNGDVSLMKTQVAAHSQESPVILERNGPTIRAYGWGEWLEITDPDPLPISAWAIFLAGDPLAVAGGAGIWQSIDNLFFAATGDPPGTSTVFLFHETSTPRAPIPYVEFRWVAGDSGVYDCESTQTVAGTVIAAWALPGSPTPTEDYDMRFRVGGRDILAVLPTDCPSTESVWLATFDPAIDSFPVASTETVRLTVENAGRNAGSSSANVARLYYITE